MGLDFMQVLLYVLTALTVSLDCKLIQTSSTKDFKHDNDSSVIGASNRDKNRPSKSETNHLSAGSQYTDLAGRETSMETSTMNTTNCRRNNSKKLIDLKVEGHSIVASKSKKEENRCNIRRVDLRKLNTDGSAADGEREEIIRSLPDTPVVYTGHRNRNLLLSYLASSQNLTNSPAGDSIVTVTSSNTFSNGMKKMTLREYIRYTVNEVEEDKKEEEEEEASEIDMTGELSYNEGLRDPVIASSSFSGSANTLMENKCDEGKYNDRYEDRDKNERRSRSNESYYLFGGNYGHIWDEMRDVYRLPLCTVCKQCGAVTIGIAGRMSGVSFHFHGPGFSEVVQGRKRWFLFPPSPRPPLHPKPLSDLMEEEDTTGEATTTREDRGRGHFDPNMTVYDWVQQEYPYYVRMKPENSTHTNLTHSREHEHVHKPNTRSISPSSPQPTCRQLTKCSSDQTEDSSDRMECSSDGTECSSGRTECAPSENSCTSGQRCNSETMHDDTAVEGMRNDFEYIRAEEYGGLTEGDASHEGDISDSYDNDDRDVEYTDGLQECVLEPGDMLYFPSGWRHATLNLDHYNVFVSLFLDLQLLK